MNTYPMPIYVRDFIPECKYKGRAILVDAGELIMFAQWYDNAEFGQIMKDLLRAAANDDLEYLSQFDFIVRVIKGSTNRESLPPSIRKIVLSAGECAYCQSKEKLTVDHIRPYSKGGTHSLDNLQCLCAKCNRAKSDKWEGDN